MRKKNNKKKIVKDVNRHKTESKSLENKVYEYSADFQFASQMKSWIAINPSFGCIWDCGYCIQHKDEFYAKSENKKVNNLYSPEEVVTKIMAHNRITSKTPLTFYNFSDPLLPQNASDLRQILTILDNRGFKNIVGLISKTFADSRTLDVISDLKNLRVVSLVSYSGYKNRQIENAPLNMRVKLMKELKTRGIPVLQYMRPIVSEWLEQDQFKRTRDKVGEYINGVIIGGIRVTPETAERIKEKGLPVPFTKNYQNKYFPKELQEKLIKIYRGVAPVYRYTSCGVSATLGISDYNDHAGFFRRTQGEEYRACPLPCKKEQSEICSCRQNPDKNKVRELLDRIRHYKVDFVIEPSGAITLDKEVSKYDLSFIRQNTSSHVDYKTNKHFVDKVANLNVKSEK